MIPEWFAAVERGDTPSLAHFVELGIDDVDTPGEFGWTALMFAVQGQHIEAARWLLSRGAEPNREQRQLTAMTLATLWAGGWEVSAGRCRAVLEPDGRFLELLKAAGGRIGLREAIFLGDVETARHLIDEGSIDINGESRFGMHDTFLMLAAHVGPVAMVDLLLDRGADIDGTDDIAFTALMIAIEMGRVGIVNRLLERGATVECGYELDFALDQANRNGHAEVIACMLSRGFEWGGRHTLGSSS